MWYFWSCVELFFVVFISCSCCYFAGSFHFFFLQRRRVVVGRVTLLFLFFYFYAIVSFFWTESTSFYLVNLFYLSCGAFLVFSIVSAVRGEENIITIFSIFMWVGGLQVLVGLLESLGLFRLPMSPYSQYYILFGHSNEFVGQWSDAVKEYNFSKPTGFSGNPNTFGFAILLLAPFFCFNPDRVVRIFSVLVFSFLVFKIDSKSLFMAYLIMYFCYFLFFKTRYLPFLVVVLSVMMFVVAGVGGGGRIVTVFSEIERGIQSLGASDFSEDSTGYRSFLYSFGFREFLDTYGFGLGLGGIEYSLYKLAGENVAFHNFYLQILVDLGFIGFFLFLAFYLLLLVFIYRGCIVFSASNLGFIYRSMFLSLIVAIFSSIAPSGIFYSLIYWVFVGYSAALVGFYSLRISSGNNLE